jgi:hypothetical protein
LTNIGAIREAGKVIQMTSVDVGNDVDADLAGGGLIRGKAALRLPSIKASPRCSACERQPHP